MQFKTQALVAAAAIAFAGMANAAVQLGSTQNSTLAFVALDAGAPLSMFIDLNYNLNDFLPTTAVNNPGTQIVWNFANNTIKVNGQLQTGSNIQWSDAYSSFLASANAANVQWAVVGADTVSGARYVTTGNPTQAAIDGQTLAKSAAAANVNNFYSGNGALGNHASVDAGANTAVSGAAFAGAGGSYQGTLATGLNWSAYAANGESNEFQFVNVQPRVGATTKAQVTTFGNPSLANLAADDALRGTQVATFTFNTATNELVWQATAVPEPATYGMVIAGLAAVGFVARRRKA